MSSIVLLDLKLRDFILFFKWFERQNEEQGHFLLKIKEGKRLKGGGWAQNGDTGSVQSCVACCVTQWLNAPYDHTHPHTLVCDGRGTSEAVAIFRDSICAQPAAQVSSTVSHQPGWSHHRDQIWVFQWKPGASPETDGTDPRRLGT